MDAPHMVGISKSMCRRSHLEKQDRGLQATTEQAPVCWEGSAPPGVSCLSLGAGYQHKHCIWLTVFGVVLL